jgi:hypothetical protein
LTVQAIQVGERSPIDDRGRPAARTRRKANGDDGVALTGELGALGCREERQVRAGGDGKACQQDWGTSRLEHGDRFERQASGGSGPRTVGRARREDSLAQVDQGQARHSLVRGESARDATEHRPVESARRDRPFPYSPIGWRPDRLLTKIEITHERGVRPRLPAFRALFADACPHPCEERVPRRSFHGRRDVYRSVGQRQVTTIVFRTKDGPCAA